MRSSECGIEEVVSSQSSVVSRVFSGDPQGSTFQLRNADFGVRNGERLDPAAHAPTRESRVTNHESRATTHESRTAQKLSGRTNPFRRKTKAAFETGRALPHVADGSVRERKCGMRISDCGKVVIACFSALSTQHSVPPPADLRCAPTSVLLHGPQLPRRMARSKAPTVQS